MFLLQPAVKQTYQKDQDRLKFYFVVRIKGGEGELSTTV